MKYKKFSLQKYLKELSSAKPVPGGGSAAALVGSLGVGLTEMVARISVKKTTKSNRAKLQKIIKAVQPVKRRLLSLVEKDARIYKKVITSYSLSKKNPKRTQSIQRALGDSYLVMKHLCDDLLLVRELNRKLMNITQGAIANDLHVSESFIKAAFASALSTANLNAAYVNNKSVQSKMVTDIKRVHKRMKK